MKARGDTARSIEKYVLIVDEPGGSLSVVMGELEELGYRVIWVPTASATLAFLEGSPKLSLLLVSARIAEAGDSQFIAQVREREPGLRIICGVRADAPAPPTSNETMMVEPFCPKALRKEASRLLAEHFDLQPAADMLSAAALEILGTLGDFRAQGAVFLKANEAVLSDFSAMIPFSNALSGHLMMSVTSQTARELHRRVLPHIPAPTLDRLEDLVGELCNQMIGRIGSRLAEHSLHIDHTTPIFIRSMGTTLRYRGRQPSLGMELTDGRAHVSVEIYFEEFDGSKLGPAVSGDLIRSNELRFF